MTSSIENLPEDVLLGIFNFLDAKSLKNSALVCTNWNDVISLSPKILKQFTLKLSYLHGEDTFWVEKFDEIMSLRRKFQSMVVYLNTDSYTNAVSLLRQISTKHGMQIRKLILNEGVFECPTDFHELLSEMPLITELEVNRVKFHWQKDQNVAPVALKYLRKLSVNSSGWYIFGFLIASPITTLKISNQFIVVDKTQILSYVKFLETSDKLESIELDLPAYVKTFSIKLSNEVRFKLRRFRCLLWSPEFETDDVARNFAAFLESQASFLTELELNYEPQIILTTIFTKLKALEKLRLNSGSLPSHNEFYHQFKRLACLKEYISHDIITSEISIKSILANSPNLETLDTRHDPHQYILHLLPFIALYNPKITHLSMDSLSVRVPSDVELAHLKYLHIEAHVNFEFLIAFLNTNAAIETLSLNLSLESIPNDETLQAVLDHPNLHHLKIIATHEVLQVVCNKIKTYCHRLRTLELITPTLDFNNILTFD